MMGIWMSPPGCIDAENPACDDDIHESLHSSENHRKPTGIVMRTIPHGQEQFLNKLVQQLYATVHRNNCHMSCSHYFPPKLMDMGSLLGTISGTRLKRDAYFHSLPKAEP